MERPGKFRQAGFIMNEFIDIYCERLGPGFWAEPLNALTNISFFIAALFAMRLARKEGMLHRGTVILIGLLLCIGMGSFLFHTLALRWAMLTDTIPILLFQVQFIALYCAHVMRLSAKKTIGVLATFFAVIYLFSLAPESILNGSLAYAPAVIFLGLFALWHQAHAKREPRILICAAALFALSLAFRSLDMQFCPSNPAGLHFLWHLLNGGVLYLTARAYILNIRPFRIT